MFRLSMASNKYIYILLPALILLVIVSITNGIDGLINNISGISDLRESGSGNLHNISECESDGIDYYPSLAACINDSISRNSSFGLELIDNRGLRKFPERKVLFDIYRGRLRGQEGDYLASCSMFQQANAKQDMQSMAETAFAKENWEALSVYLNCIGAPSEQSSGVSSPRIGVLFHDLGKYYSRIGREDKALEAYQRAINWYPTPWAAPILAAVKILENKGLYSDAKNLVAGNFELATLPWSKFYLGLKLGEYKLGENDWLGAYCAYLEASIGAESSPMNQVPEMPRKEVLKTLNMLEVEYHLTPEQCDKDP
jgi:tetratricopeptide (TPR) repeat protein